MRLPHAAGRFAGRPVRAACCAALLVGLAGLILLAGPAGAPRPVALSATTATSPAGTTVATEPAAAQLDAGLATRLKAQLHTDVAVVDRNLRAHRSQIVLGALIAIAWWTAGRLVRRRLAGRWVSRHVALALSTSPAAKFDAHVSKRRARPGARTPGVVRIELSPARTTTAACVEVLS